jgi:hypothetical protein
MNYQRKVRLVKGSETIELEIDNQLVFVRKSSSNQEETKVLRSLEEAEAHFYGMKTEFEGDGFAEQAGNTSIPEVPRHTTNIVKASNPHRGSVPGQLANEVVEQIRRLGGEAHPDKRPPIVIDNFIAPDAIALWYASHLMALPRKRFKTDEDENGSYWVWDMWFESAASCEEFPARGKDGKLLSMIGMADGGNYIVAIDLNDPDPSNPRVYVMDHDDPEQELGDGVKLSDFLADLTEEQQQLESS